MLLAAVLAPASHVRLTPLPSRGAKRPAFPRTGPTFFLFGIEEVGIQIEEPFSILPLEAFCNGAIVTTTEEMLGAVQSGVFEEDQDAVLPGPS